MRCQDCDSELESALIPVAESMRGDGYVCTCCKRVHNSEGQALKKLVKGEWKNVYLIDGSIITK